MTPSIELFGCRIHQLTMQGTVNLIDRNITNRIHTHHVVVNAAKLVHMQTDDELRESVINCDIINADGQAVVWAAKLLGKPLPERVAGVDLMQNLVALAHEKHYRVFFLGAREEVVKAVVDQYSKKYAADLIAGYRNGYFNKAEESTIAQQIGDSGADILFVAISSPTKEIFLNTYKQVLNVPFVMGVGGSFDVVAGKVKRAPQWMQRTGLEWLYRVIQEPRRMWKRYLVTNTLFIVMLIKEKLKFNNK